MEGSAAQSIADTEYMAYASETRRSTIRVRYKSCPLAAFVVRVQCKNADGSIACIEVVTRREQVLPPGELRPANKYEVVAGRAADLMAAMPERHFVGKPAAFAIGRWSVDEISKRTGLSPWTIYGCIDKAGIKTTLSEDNVVFRASKLLRYTDVNRIIDACIPPRGWCTRKQATEMTGLAKEKLDKSGVGTMTPPKFPGAPKTVWYNIEGLRDVRRACAVYGGVAPLGRKPGRKHEESTVQVDVKVPKGSTAMEHIALIRKAVDGRRKTKVNIIYVND